MGGGSSKGKKDPKKSEPSDKTSKAKGKKGSSNKADDKKPKQDGQNPIMVENIDEFEMKSNDGEEKNDDLARSEQMVKRSLEPRYDLQASSKKKLNDPINRVGSPYDGSTKFNFSKRNLDELPMNSSANMPNLKSAGFNEGAARVPTDQSETDLVSKYKKNMQAPPEKQPSLKGKTKEQDSATLKTESIFGKKGAPLKKGTKTNEDTEEKDQREGRSAAQREQISAPQKVLAPGTIWGGYQDETPIWFMSFHVKYDQNTQQFQLLKTYDHLILANMKLSPLKKEKGDSGPGTFQVEILNQELFNLKNGTKKIFSKTPKMVFPITSEGKSVGSIDYKEIIDMAEQNIAGEYSVGTLKKLYEAERKKLCICQALRT